MKHQMDIINHTTQEIPQVVFLFLLRLTEESAKPGIHRFVLKSAEMDGRPMQDIYHIFNGVQVFHRVFGYAPLDLVFSINTKTDTIKIILEDYVCAA